MTAANLESLANELLLEIFDYLRPFDIMKSFGKMNSRLENLILERPMHIDPSKNFSLHDFETCCDMLFTDYSSCVYSIRLSNIETCGVINLFLNKFSQTNATFPKLFRMSFMEPSENDYRRILELRYLSSVQVKYAKLLEQKIHLGHLFNNLPLETCILSYDDVLFVRKLAVNIQLKRLVLDGFYLNDLNILFCIFPALEHLTVHRLMVNFEGYLPPFEQPINVLRTLQINCFYTVRFDYLEYIISFCSQLRRLTVVAIGIDFMSSERWIQMLRSLPQLQHLTLDLKAIFPTVDDDLSSPFLTGSWHKLNVAVDYSQDNHKYHLYTVPYGRSSFISTIQCLSVAEAPDNAFNSVTDLYLKVNLPTQSNVRRMYSNSRALQIYQNAMVLVVSSALLEQINSMICLGKLVRFELFVPLLSIDFLTLLNSMPCLQYFKTDYDILMDLTGYLQFDDICTQLNNKLERIVIRQGAFPITFALRFCEQFSNVKHLQINLNTFHDLRVISTIFVKHMTHTQTFNIMLIDNNQSSDTFLWEGVVNNVSYEVSKRRIRIWK